MRKRYQNGSLKQRCGKWVGQWWEDGHRRNLVLGPVSKMTKSKAREELTKRLEVLRAGEMSKGGKTGGRSARTFCRCESERLYDVPAGSKEDISASARNFGSVNP